MKISATVLMLAVIAALGLIVGPALSSVDAADYVGVTKCKMCHSSKAMGGTQYKVWQTTKHANALETLKGDDAKNPKCLKCHTTGYGKTAASGADLSGVQCEACHGPGSAYKSTRIMSKKAFKENRDAAHQKAVDAGLIIPDENVCKSCHNSESPQFKGFDFAAYKEKIKHW